MNGPHLIACAVPGCGAVIHDDQRLCAVHWRALPYAYRADLDYCSDTFAAAATAERRERAAADLDSAAANAVRYLTALAAHGGAV